MAQYVRLHDTDASAERPVLPLPEPSDISKASLVNFEDVELELKKESASLQGKPDGAE